MDKLELMAFMLPTGFNVIDMDESLIKNNIEHVSFNSFRTINEVIRRKSYKLILRPLSDFIGCDMNSFEFKVVHQISCFYDNGDYLRIYDKKIDIDSLPLYVIKILIANHFDIAGLIEKGEAVDYRTLPDFVFSIEANIQLCE